MRFVSLPRLPCLAVTYASASSMSFRNLALLFVVVDSLLLPSVGQSNHAVTVGQLGSFYDPSTLSAGLNDTVTFIFEGPFHTVTQSSLENPCVPLPGGFNSGVLGRGTNDSTTPSPTWTITITNISQPIWYFCEISTPTSHCESGMVGAINPPSQEVYQQFHSAAEAVTGTPAPSPTLVLSGIGAVASQGPITPPPSSPPSQSKTTPHLGTIIGAAVGGALGALLILAALIWWLVQRKAARNVPDSPTSDDSNFFRYNPGPVRVRRPSEAFVAAKAMENSMVSAFPLPPDSAAALAPNRRSSTSPGNVAPPAGIPRKTSNQALDRKPSLQSTLASPGVTEQTSNVDMRALATQVAAVLRNSPSGGTLSTSTNTTGSPTASSMQHQAFRADKRLGLHTADPSHSSQDPPAYRAAMGTPGQDVLKPNRA